MPSPKYTKIEITPKAYLALEAETVLQSKTLKSLASELILNGVSQESLDFAQRAIASNEARTKLNGGNITKAIKDIGITGIKIDEAFLGKVQKKLQEDGYLDTMLYVAQHTASIQRDELHRVLTICEYHKIPPLVAADVIRNLNNIESGIL
jgi:hypothetical protein